MAATSTLAATNFNAAQRTSASLHGELIGDLHVFSLFPLSSNFVQVDSQPEVEPEEKDFFSFDFQISHNPI
ncbi:hypothetical protein Fmac_031968 [Flemingia macrophylla]|uniref:Uncharacterized protein n=1 Tax=Flemingia macrophylla TaxID=520843 RepID=A0ABD1L3K3_9FABA